MRWTGPCTQRTLCTFSSGTQVVCRQTRPREATTYRSSAPQARKWYVSGAFHRAAAGGRSDGCGGAPSSSASIWSASARDPTGMTARSRWPSAWFSRRCRAPATSTSSRHQPNTRQISGSTRRTAWIRPGLMVSAVVWIRPDRSRMPSRAAVTVVPYSPFSWRHRFTATPSTMGRNGATVLAVPTEHDGQASGGGHDHGHRAGPAEQDRRWTAGRAGPGTAGARRPRAASAAGVAVADLASSDRSAAAVAASASRSRRRCSASARRRQASLSAVRGVTARHSQLQLGQAEHPGQSALNDVDGLDLRQREPPRVTPQQPGLDAEHAVGDLPARHEPADESAGQRDGRRWPGR